MAGQILFATPDRHLVVTDGRIRLSAGPKENFSRPAVDPLFRSAAIQYGRDVIGVLLSGDLDDGTVGLQIIKSYGGIAVVQDPEQAEAPSMPKNAMNHVHVDWCLPLDQLAPKLIELTAQGAPTSVLQSVPPIRDLDTLENRFQTRNPPSMDEYMALSQPSVHTCPECNGVLGEIDDRTVLRYRCHTGHAFTASTLADAQQRSTEEALWGAVRALQEKEALLSKLATRADENGRPSQGNEHRRAAQLARTQSESVRNLLIDVRHTTRLADRFGIARNPNEVHADPSDRRHGTSSTRSEGCELMYLADAIAFGLPLLHPPA